MIGDVAAGLRHGEAAARTAGESDPEPGLRHFLEAWSRNVYAYSLFRHQRSEQAVAQCLQAAELLADAPAHPAVPHVQVLTTRWHLFDNPAKAATAAGDSDRAVGWQRRRNALAGSRPTSHRPPVTWLLPGVRNPDLRSETAALEAQLRQATTDLDLPWWDLPRLAPAALTLAESGDLTPDVEPVRLGLRSLAVAATQRADCQPAAGRLAEWIALADV